MAGTKDACGYKKADTLSESVWVDMYVSVSCGNVIVVGCQEKLKKLETRRVFITQATARDRH